MSEGNWAITYHSYSSSPRAKKWYRVARVACVDGTWFELYHHSTLYGGNKVDVRERARDLGVDLLPGVYTAIKGPRRGSEIERKS